MTPRLAELLLLGAGSISSAHRVLSRRGLCAAFGTFATAGVSLPAAATSVESNGVAFTFTESSLGLELATSSTGRVRIERIKPNSPAIPKGVPPLATILEVNGVDATSLPVEQVQSLIRGASRPLTLRLDVSEFRALPAVAQTEAAAAALGMATDRIQIDLITGPQDPSCGYKTRASDVVEVEFAARVVGGGEFDSSERRSGRPFAFLLGNGDVSRGLEVCAMGCFVLRLTACAAAHDHAAWWWWWQRRVCARGWLAIAPSLWPPLWPPLWPSSLLRWALESRPLSLGRLRCASERSGA